MYVTVPIIATLYNSIGGGYSERRQPDPGIFEIVRTALGEAQRIVNVGAGAGSYEPAEITAAAVEPSSVMAAQRPAHMVPAVLASAESLPFVDGAFDGALAVLTIHHWNDPARGLRELRRVTDGPIVILTFDPGVATSWWLPRDYAPELAPLTFGDAPDLQVLESALGRIEVQVVPVPARCRDGFLMSFWDRPELVLDPEARAATSGFARLSDDVQERICQTLGADLRSGKWDARYGELRTLPEFDSGLRLVRASNQPRLRSTRRDRRSPMTNAEVVLAVIRAVEQRDLDALFELYHDDVELLEAPSLPYAHTARGKSAMREQLEAAPETTWLGTWGPLQPTERERRMDPRVVATNGEEVTVAYTTRALSSGGERFESPVLALYEVRDGKFARGQMFHYDTAAILAFLDRA